MARTQTCCEYMYDSDSAVRMIGGEEALNSLSEASEVVRPPLKLTSCILLFAGCCVKFFCTSTACWGLFSLGLIQNEIKRAREKRASGELDTSSNTVRLKLDELIEPRSGFYFTGE